MFRFVIFSDVPINRHRQVLALFEGIVIGSYLKNRHRQLFKESVSVVIWRVGIGKILPIPFNNLTIINCLSWLKSATLEIYKTKNTGKYWHEYIRAFLYIHELLDLLLEFALYIYKNYY